MQWQRHPDFNAIGEARGPHLLKLVVAILVAYVDRLFICQIRCSTFSRAYSVNFSYVVEIVLAKGLTTHAEKKDKPSPVALEQHVESADQRIFSPSAAQNSAPILAVLKRVRPARGVVLEIGSGTGEHVVQFAKATSALTWVPSDPYRRQQASCALLYEVRGTLRNHYDGRCSVTRDNSRHD